MESEDKGVGMYLSTVLLALYLFLQSAALLGWFAVSNVFMGVIALITAILLLIESGPVIYNKYVVRRP